MGGPLSQKLKAAFRHGAICYTLKTNFVSQKTTHDAPTPRPAGPDPHRSGADCYIGHLGDMGRIGDMARIGCSDPTRLGFDLSFDPGFDLGSGNRAGPAAAQARVLAAPATAAPRARARLRRPAHRNRPR